MFLVCSGQSQYHKIILWTSETSTKQNMNNITPEKSPPAKITDGDAEGMLHVGLVNMPDGSSVNLEDRSKFFEDGRGKNVKQILSKFASQSTTINTKFKLTANQSARNTFSEQLKVSLLHVLSLTIHGTASNWQVLIASAELRIGDYRN